jgi:hypothetical protein
MLGFGIVGVDVLGFKTMYIDTYYFHVLYYAKLIGLFICNTNPCLRDLLSERLDLHSFLILLQ